MYIPRLATLVPGARWLPQPATDATTSRTPKVRAKFTDAERGLARSGIKVIGPGDLTDDDDLNNMGDQMLGMITAGPYSATHDSALNKSYVAGIQKANGFRPDFVSLGAYDGLHLIYEALKKTGGNPEGEALIAAMKGMAWESPRGPMSIDRATGDVIHDIYRYAKTGFASIAEDDFERFKWFGVYRQKPKDSGFFMMRTKVPGGQISAAQAIVL